MSQAAYVKIEQSEEQSMVIDVVRRVSTSVVQSSSRKDDSEQLNSQYIDVVRRVSAKTFESGGTIVAERRVTGRNKEMVGNADIGVLEMTRRLSGTAAAIFEGLDPVKKIINTLSTTLC